MENEVVIHIRAEDDTAAGFAKARASAKKAAEDIEKDLKQAGRKGGKGLADGIGDAIEHDIPVLASKATDKLGEAGEKGGSKLGQGVKKGLKDALPSDGERGGILSSLLPDAGKLFKAGASAGASVVEGLGSSLQKTADSPYLIGGLAAAGVAAAPLIGTLVGAAVIGGAAGVGIVGGFAAAAANPQVRGSVIALGDVVGDGLKDSVKGFVPAAVHAIDMVRDKWLTIQPVITSIFSKAGDVTAPLVSGILDGVESIIEGIDDVIGESGPVVESFGKMFREVGDALGSLLSSLSDDSDTAAAALDFFTQVLVGAVDMIHIFTEVSLDMIEAFRPAGEVIGDAYNAVDGWVRGLTGATDETGNLDSAQGDLTGTIDDATRAANEQLEALRQVEEQMRKQTDPLFEVFDLQTKVSKAQEAYTSAVKESGPESAKARKALLDMGKASFELTSALTTAAGEGFNGKLTPAMRSALRNAGLTAKQISNLEHELIAARRAAEKWAKTYKAVYITQYKTMGLKSSSPVFQGYAHGGVTGAENGATSSGLTMVGEHGPELINLPPGTRVHSNPDSVRMTSGQGASMGPGGGFLAGGKLEIILKFDPSAAPMAIRGVMEGIRGEVRDGGGSVQTVLGVAGVA